MPTKKSVAKQDAPTTVRITLKRSLSGQKPKLRRVLEGMGLTRINQSATMPNIPSTKGMIKIVSALVEVTEETGK